MIMEDSALANAIHESADKVFKSMFAMEVNSNGFERRAELQAGNEVLSIIGIRGEWKGSFMLVCDANSACKLVSTMLGTDIPTLNNEVLDGIGELANIMMGNLKDALEEGSKEVAMTPPTVVQGDNMIVRARAKQEWLVVPFTTCNSRFEVRMAIKE